MCFRGNTRFQLRQIQQCLFNAILSVEECLTRLLHSIEGAEKCRAWLHERVTGVCFRNALLTDKHAALQGEKQHQC